MSRPCRNINAAVDAISGSFTASLRFLPAILPPSMLNNPSAPSLLLTYPAGYPWQHHLPGPGRRPRHAALSADQVPLQAGRAAGGQVPPDRHSAVELHQQRAEPDLRADAVQLGQPAPPHPRRRTGSTSSTAASSRSWPPSRHDDAKRTGTRAPPTPCGKNLRYLAAAGHRVRADPLRRPALPHGISATMLRTHQEAEADVTIAGMPVDRADGQARMRHHAGRRRTAASAAFWKSRRPTRKSTSCAMDPAWIDARGIDSQGPRLPGQHGHLPVQPRHAGRRADQDRLPRLRQGDFPRRRSGPSSVQLHLFDGYWEDIGTIRAFYEANLGLAGRIRRFELASRRAAPIYTRPRFLPPTLLDGATIKGSLIADGCQIGRGRGDRKQRDRPAVASSART